MNIAVDELRPAKDTRLMTMILHLSSGHTRMKEAAMYGGITGMVKGASYQMVCQLVLEIFLFAG